MSDVSEKVLARSLERLGLAGQSRQPKKPTDHARLRTAELPLIQRGRLRVAMSAHGESCFPWEVVVSHG